LPLSVVDRTDRPVRLANKLTIDPRTRITFHHEKQEIAPIAFAVSQAQVNQVDSISACPDCIPKNRDRARMIFIAAA
jgi:hypothetical protein